MDGQPILSKLRDIFAYLYPTEGDAARVATDAGLEIQRINLKNTTLNIWHAIFEEAKRVDRVRNVIAIGRREYCTNPQLRAVCDEYFASLAIGEKQLRPNGPDIPPPGEDRPSYPITPIRFEWIWISAGQFFMDEDRRRSTAYLPGYFIAKVPVTNRQYWQFVEETGYRPPKHWVNRGPFITRLAIPPGKEEHPVINVSWQDAQAFCEWSGVQLPSVEEWVKAARGHTECRLYPWGDAPPSHLTCNFNNRKGGTTPVGQYLQGSSPYGCLDMSGNVREFTRNRISNLCTICGGAFNDSEETMHCVYSDQDNAENAFDNVGFRVSSPGSVI